MLSRISRIRVQAAPTRLRHLRAYSAAPNVPEPTPAEPGALDVDDAHLLPPDSTVLGSLDERNPIGEIARALHLPIGDEPHLAEAGLEPPHVIQQNAPEPVEDSPSPLVEPIPESETSPAEGSASSSSERGIPHDISLGLTREPTQAEYDSRRIVVEVHNGIRHMANAFAVIRYLERTYGRVSHFNLGRSADVEEDYRGAMFVTFKHPLSLQRIAQAGVLSAHIPEPAHTIPFRPGSVGIDELQDVLTRPVEEFGDAEQQALFQAEAIKREAQLAAAAAPENDAVVDSSAPEKAADTPPSADPAVEEEEEMVEVDGKMWPKSLADSLKEDHLLALIDFGATETQADWNHSGGNPSPTGAQDGSAAHTRAFEGNLPQLFLKIQPFHAGYDMTDHSRAFGDGQKDILRPRPMPSQQFAIGSAFAQFRGFAPATASTARMETVLRNWRPFMPAGSQYQATPAPAAEAEAAPAPAAAAAAAAGPVPAPEAEPEFRLLDTVPLDALPKPKWQMRAPPVREQPVLEQQAQSTAAAASAAAPAMERRPAGGNAKAKSDVQRPKKAAALEAARKAARAANQRAAKEWAAQAAAVEARLTPTAQPSAAPAPQTSSAPAAQASAAPAARSAPLSKGSDAPVSQPAETQGSSWRKLTSRLSSFIGGGGGGGGSSPRQ